MATKRKTSKKTKSSQRAAYKRKAKSKSVGARKTQTKRFYAKMRGTKEGRREGHTKKLNYVSRRA